MSTYLTLAGATVAEDVGRPGRWKVVHWNRACVLAYCDTYERAVLLAETFGILTEVYGIMSHRHPE